MDDYHYAGHLMRAATSRACLGRPTGVASARSGERSWHHASSFLETGPVANGRRIHETSSRRARPSGVWSRDTVRCRSRQTRSLEQDECECAPFTCAAAGCLNVGAASLSRLAACVRCVDVCTCPSRARTSSHHRPNSRAGGAGKCSLRSYKRGHAACSDERASPSRQSRLGRPAVG